MKKAIKDILSLVKKSYGNLEIVETTISPNGYPSGTKYSLIGFEDEKQLDEVRKMLPGVIDAYVSEHKDDNDFHEGSNVNFDILTQLLMKEDGWHFWYRVSNNYMYDVISVSNDFDTKYGHDVFVNGEFTDEKDFIESNDIPGMMYSCGNTFKDMIDIIKRYKEAWEKYNGLKEGEILVVDYENGTYEVMKDKVMKYRDDNNKEFAIGLTVFMY